MPEETAGQAQWDADAAVACGPVGNNGEAVDRPAAVEVERVWQPHVVGARPALSFAPDDDKAAAWGCVRWRCGRRMDYLFDCVVFDDQEHLSVEIDLERIPEPNPRARSVRVSKRVQSLRPDNPVARKLFPALEGDDRMPRFFAEHTVDASVFEIAKRREPTLRPDDYRAARAIANRPRHGSGNGCRQHDGECCGS